MGDEEAASAADAATKTVEETLGEAAETLNATLNATAEAAAELGPMAGGKMTALIVGGIGVAIALFVVHRRRTEAQRQLLEGGLFRSMSGAREDDDEPGAIKFDKDGKIEEVEGYDATGDNGATTSLSPARPSVLAARGVVPIPRTAPSSIGTLCTHAPLAS